MCRLYKLTKKQFVVHVFLILICFSLLCCRKNKLPEETQEGNKTFGCTIDGRIFKPKWFTLDFLEPRIVFVLTQNGQAYSFQIAGYRKASNCVRTWVGVFGDSVRIEEGSRYIINEKKAGNFHGIYQRGACYDSPHLAPLTTDAISAGEILFTRVDLINKVVSGTFWFDVKDENGSTIKIRDGRFDMPV